MDRRDYVAGELIYTEGTASSRLYYIAAGVVRVSTAAGSDGEVLAHLSKGSTFGESALLSDRPYPNVVRAVSDCTILTLSRQSFEQFLAEHPAAAQAVRNALTQRTVYSRQQMIHRLLAPMALFAGLPPDFLGDVTTRLTPHSVRRDSLIFDVGERADVLYLIEQGQVALLSDAHATLPLVTLGAGDFFGEGALISGAARSYAARAMSDSDLWALSRSAFDELLPQYPAAALAMTRTMMGRVESLNRQILDLALRGKAVAPTGLAARSAQPWESTVVRPPVARPIPRPTAPVPRPAPVAVQAAPRPPRPSVALRPWFSQLAPGAKVRLVTVAVLVAWLAVVTIPNLLSGAMGRSSQGTLGVGRQDLGVLVSSRGGRLFESVPVAAAASLSGMELTDMDAAPLVRASELLPARTEQPSAPGPAAPVAPKAAATYTVVPGDTLSRIAAQFNVDIGVLIEVNKIADPALIRIGQELVIPGGEEQARIAAELATRPTPTPAPVVAPAPPPAPQAPAPAAEVQAKPALPFVWDGRLDKLNVRLEAAAVPEGQPYWRLVKALWRDAGEPCQQGLPCGDHNIYVEVLDENGARAVGQKVIVQNGGLATLIQEKKPFPEYGANFPMYGMLGSYSVWVDGLPSDKVVGMGLPMKQHVTYYLTFQRTVK